jgi:hypothetical protein
MKTNRLTYVKNILIPCLVFSTATGIGTGLLIFLFKWAASAVIGLSSTVYDAVREHPAYLPLLFLGALVLGLTAAFVLRKVPDCRACFRAGVWSDSRDEYLCGRESFTNSDSGNRERWVRNVIRSCLFAMRQPDSSDVFPYTP